MIFKTSKIKALMKEAWKTTGLVVGMTERDGGDFDQCYFAGSNWTIAVNYEDMTKELKGALIELVGDLPSPGDEIISYKGNNQSQVGFEEHFDIRSKLHEELEGRAYKAADTALVVDDPNGKLRIYACENGEVMTVLEKLSQAIDYSAIDEANGEGLLSERIRVKDGEKAMLMWATDSCYVAAYHIEPDEEGQAWSYVQGIKQIVKTNNR